MKKLVSILLSVILLCAGLQTAAAATYARIPYSCGATVIQVIDGDSLRVRLVNSGELALVRLLGVDATGSDEAFNYLSARLTGKYVSLEPDTYVRDFTDRWNLMYVFYQGNSVNEEMLNTGYATLNPNHRSAAQYTTLSDFEANAQANEVGRWSVDESDSLYAYSGNGVNINTATAAQMQAIFTGVSQSVARNIVDYRKYNPFDSIREVKFVSGFTRTMFDNNRRYMTVSTNLNTASRDELSTLANITSSMIQGILDYRSNRYFNRVYQLSSADILSNSVYNANEPFMNVDNRTTITVSIPDKIVNINTATRAQLEDIGLTTKQADALIAHRKEYSYKTLEELAFVPVLKLTRSKIDELADNINTVTAINNAELPEIKSLLGSASTNTLSTKVYDGRPYKTLSALSDLLTTDVYNSLRPFVYINASDAVPTRVNLNTATSEQLTDIGFTTSQAEAIIRDRPYKNSLELPVDVSDFDKTVALYTNVNEATREELRTLSTRMTDVIIDELIDYRKSQPFGSPEELSDFFGAKSRLPLYREIQDYVVLR